MNEEEKIMIETNRSITNMETCFRNKIKELEQENQQLKEQLEKEKEVKSKAIGHINACGGELTKNQCKYLLQILDIYKGE